MAHVNTTNLSDARRALRRDGGWLLALGDGHYLVTDDEGTVYDMRGPEHLATCERTQQWDETQDLSHSRDDAAKAEYAIAKSQGAQP